MIVEKIRGISYLKNRKKPHFRVAIFGSARIKRSDRVYKQVKNLAEMLAKSGADVVTGGGPGLMQAANEGHKKGDPNNKLHSVGLGIRLQTEQGFNKSVEYRKTFRRFSNRLDQFMSLSNAVVVAPGGIGTILELFYTWQLVQVKHICHIPIILLGKDWRGLIEWMKKNPMKKKYFEKVDLENVFLVDRPEEAMEIINQAHEAYTRGGKNFCVNYKKYKIS